MTGHGLQHPTPHDTETEPTVVDEGIAVSLAATGNGEFVHLNGRRLTEELRQRLGTDFVKLCESGILHDRSFTTDVLTVTE